ncbi:hypothetical protein ACIQ7D_21665 [Streptomyces sp. NPDC096310]|uniref:MmyB family transcriptional regulator n=1 Tax=Streptomyces sp. NPDC096310 TaxID=3366082 RepID=UPI00381AE9AE
MLQQQRRGRRHHQRPGQADGNQQQHFHHPAVGDLDLDYDALEIPADPGLTIVTYPLAPTSPQAPAFRRLQQLIATPAEAPSRQPAAARPAREGVIDGRGGRGRMPRSPGRPIAVRPRPVRSVGAGSEHRSSNQPRRRSRQVSLGGTGALARNSSL